MDYYGPLPTSSGGGGKYVLVIVDNFTKYVELYALRRATTNVSLKREQQYITTHGKPNSVLTDNGTQFTSHKWTQGLKDLNIKPKYTAIRNPCTNIAERWNRQLGNLQLIPNLRTRKAHKMGYVYKNNKGMSNETYQDTIKVTPYEAQFGTKPGRHWEKYLDPIVINNESVDIEKLQLRIKERGERQAARINKLSKITAFEVGDQVLIRTHKLSDATQNIIGKFCALYEGPYTITRKVGSDTYQIQDDVNSSSIRGIFNTRQKKQRNYDTCLLYTSRCV